MPKAPAPPIASHPDALAEATRSSEPPGGNDMTAEIESPVVEHLRAIRADLADLRREVAGNSVRISAMGRQLAGLTTAVYASKSDLDDSERRLDRVERRLEPTDAAP